MVPNDAAGDETSGPRNLFDDFSGYRTASDEDYQEIFRTGIVTLDTNVLLDLYRQHGSASDQLFVAMERLGDRLWFAHQVLAEFHRNREGATAEPADEADKAIDDLNDLRQKVLTRFRTWARRVGLSDDREREHQRQVESGFDALKNGIEQVLADHDPEIAADTSTDPILERLDHIVTGRRGTPMDPPIYAAAVAEGKRRVAEKIPPGYRDADKNKRPEVAGAAGDYLVWEQFLVEAAARNVDGLFVTRDVKEDWFRLRGGEVQGPRNELAEEYRKRTGKRLFMLRAASWIHHMKPLLAGGDVRIDATVEALDRPSDEAGQGIHERWTRTSVQRLIDELRTAYPVQFSAIQEAHRSAGYVSREQIYELADYPPYRSLRGFTRPIERLTRAMVDENLLPYYVEPALTPRYNFAVTGNNKAIGFAMSEGFRSTYSDVYGEALWQGA